jgi:thiaminase/transcriptional activator TenA
VARSPIAPTNLAYISYLLVTAYGGSFPELLTVVLPYYWIYLGGRQVARRAGTARSAVLALDQFGDIVRAVLVVTDRIGPELSSVERGRADDRFITSWRYEWTFWEMGYRREQRPI